MAAASGERELRFSASMPESLWSPLASMEYSVTPAEIAVRTRLSYRSVESNSRDSEMTLGAWNFS